VANASLADQRRIFQARIESAQLTFGAAAAKLAILHRGDAGGVVPAILKTLQRVEQLSGDRSGA
jgi:hypothetical protein